MNETGTNASIRAIADPDAGMTLQGLIDAYRTDRISTYHQLRYHEGP